MSALPDQTARGEAVTQDPWTCLAGLTPARLALGRSGSSLPTREVLKLGQAHARARDAVHAALDAEGLAARISALGRPTLQAESAAPDRATYLRRPDLGRTLSDASRARLAAARADDVDLAVAVADGLSATAVDSNAIPLLEALLPLLGARSLAPVIVARQARVALGDGIGAALGARMVVVLIGERPGLSAADSLGAYLTFGPRTGLTDADRNCVSNIRAAGLGPAAAAHKVAWLVGRAFASGATGVALKDESDIDTVAGSRGRGQIER